MEKKYNNKKLTTEEFIERARKVHRDKYSYEHTVYNGGKKPITVTCHKHGDFTLSTARQLLKGEGCRECTRENKTMSTEEFIQRAKEKHGYKYDYSKSICKGSHQKINIVCPKHGIFSCEAKSHLRGVGCQKCFNDRRGKSFTYSQEEWITKAKEIHGDKYDYSNVNYLGSYKKVIITCPMHGDFEQLPTKHLQGQGCPICKSSKLENKIRKMLKNSKIEYEEQKRFDWLKYKNNLLLDFYLPKYNIAIECQGEQPFGLGGWGDNFIHKIVQKRDKLKKKLCEEHGIKLLYFSNLGIEYPYNVIEDENILLEEIKKVET